MRASSPTTSRRSSAHGAPARPAARRARPRDRAPTAASVARRRAPRSRAAGSRRLDAAPARARIDARQRRVGRAEIDADDVSRVRPRHPRARGGCYALGWWRTPNSSFQRCLPSRATHQSSSVPISVRWTRRRTGTSVPAWSGHSSVGHERRELLDLVAPDLEHGAERVLFAAARAEEAELGRLADDEAELLAGQLELACPPPCPTARGTAP